MITSVEATLRRCSPNNCSEKFLKIFKMCRGLVFNVFNLQSEKFLETRKKTCAGVLFLIKLQTEKSWQNSQ